MTGTLAQSLARLCAGEVRLPSGFGADELARLAEVVDAQRVGPWLHRRACAGELALPGAFLSRLRQAAARSAAQTQLDAAVRKEVLGALVHEGLHPVPLKGTVLGPWLYGDAALRPNHDLDVLLPPEETPLGALVLARLGFRAVHRNHTPWLDGMSHERAYWRGDDLPVELHRHITQPRRFRVPLQELLARAERWDYEGIPVRRLTGEDQFLHLAVHAAHHKFLIPMIHWLDFKLLIDRGIDLETVANRARRYGAQTVLRIVAERLETLFGERRLSAWVSPLGRSRRRALRGLLTPSLAAEPTHGYRDAWYAFWLIERNRDRAAFALEYALRWSLDRPYVRNAQKSRQLRSDSRWRSFGLSRLNGFSVFSPGRSGSPQPSQ